MSTIREITTHRVNGVNDRIAVFAVDAPGVGGANHEYAVLIPVVGVVIRAEWDSESVVHSLGLHKTLMLWRWRGVARIVDSQSDGSTITTDYLLQYIAFQNGAVREAGINGNTNEVMLAIAIDRLEGFQNGQFKNRENAIALTHLETAKLWLHKRTMDRVARGVEGTLVK